MKLHRLGSHLTYANVMATIAVFLGLGGVSYAATHLPSNSVGTKQLKRAAVTRTKLDAKLRALLGGPKGVASTGYAYYWSTARQTVLGGSATRFSDRETDGATTSYSNSSGQITFKEGGVYDVRFTILSTDADGIFSLRRNFAGSIAGSTYRGIDHDVLHHDYRAYDGEAVIEVDDGDTVALVNNRTTPSTLVVTNQSSTAVNASLTINRLR